MQRDAEAEDKLLVQRKGRVALALRAQRHTQRGWTADVVCCGEAFSAPASPDADQPMALRRAPDTFPNLQKTEYIPHTQHSPDSSTSPTPPTLLRHQIWVASVPHICNQVSGVLRKRGRRRYAENMANTVLFGCCSWVFEGDADALELFCRFPFSFSECVRNGFGAGGMIGMTDAALSQGQEKRVLRQALWDRT